MVQKHPDPNRPHYIGTLGTDAEMNLVKSFTKQTTNQDALRVLIELAKEKQIKKERKKKPEGVN